MKMKYLIILSITIISCSNYRIVIEDKNIPKQSEYESKYKYSLLSRQYKLTKIKQFISNNEKEDKKIYKVIQLKNDVYKYLDKNELALIKIKRLGNIDKNENDQIDKEINILINNCDNIIIEYNTTNGVDKINE